MASGGSDKNDDQDDDDEDDDLLAILKGVKLNDDTTEKCMVSIRAFLFGSESVSIIFKP